MPTNRKIGDRIENRWEIHKILRGGMGIVYIVYDHDWHEPFAVKTFQDEIFIRNPAIANRFTQEALTWVKLDIHQNVTRARFVETIHGKPCLVLEYVSGGDLDGWIGTPRLTEDLPQVLRFAIHFCDGMIHALSKGITAHRDIKPQNCLITEDRTLKVTDFGLAKIFDDAEMGEKTTDVDSLKVGLTRTGVAAGTPTHMAPEQFDDAKHVNVRADIYSFGVMLYQMIEGRLPFEGRSWEELACLHKSQELPSLRGQLPGVNVVVQTCLAKSPRARFGDFAAVREGLVSIYEGLTDESAPQPVMGKELDAVGWSNKGISMVNLGWREEAIDCYDRAIELNPRNEVTWSNKGAALDALSRRKEAIACYDRAIDLNPHFEQAWSNKGHALNALSRREEAIACYDQAIDLNPRYENAWNNKGNALRELGRSEEAIACFDQAIELNPRYEVSWYNKGSLSNVLGRYKEAIACYDRALDLNPHLVEAWNNKGNTLNTLGRYEEAIACCDQAIDLNPRYENAWNNKGSSLIALGRIEEAIACYDKALELNSSYEFPWSGKGVALNVLGRIEEAIACFDQAIELNPRFAEAWHNKGAVLSNSGRIREAFVCFEEARRLGLS